MTGHQQPRVQLRAAPRVDALEQLTGPFEVERARLDVGHVETGGGREAGHDRVTDEHVGRAEGPAEPGETPAERTERIVCRREQLGAELAPAQWAFGQQDAGQQGPRLVAAHRPQLTIVGQDRRLADQSDVHAACSSRSRTDESRAD